MIGGTIGSLSSAGGGVSLSATNTWTAGQTYTSSNTFNAAIVISSNVNLGNGQGTIGQVFTSQAGSAPTWTTVAGGSGSSVLGVSSGSATNSVIITSPTSNIVVDSNTFIASKQGSTTSYLQINPSSVTLLGQDLSGTYLTNSSATATYLQLSSATATYLNKNQATNGTVTNVTGTSPISSSGGNTPAISLLQTIAQNETFSSSVTVTAPLGSSTTFGVYAGSMTGANLSTCGDATHAVSYSATTGLFNCQSILGNTGGVPTLGVSSGSASNSVVVTSPTSNVVVDSNTFIASKQGSTTSYLQLNSSSVTLQGPLPTLLGTVTAGVWNGTAIQPGYLVFPSTVAFISSTNTWTAGQTFASSTTHTAAVVFSSNVVLGNGQGTAGQFMTSQAGSAPTWTTSTGASLSSTQTWTAAQIYTSSVAHNNGFYTVPVTYTANTTIVATNTVVLASATASAGITITLDASNAANNGQILQITKVNASTYPVTIVPNGTDLISGSTRTLTLNALSQTDEIIADGAGNWWPHGPGLQLTPQRIYVLSVGAQQNDTNGVNASSDIVTCPFYTPVPVSVTGFTYYGTTANGNIAIGIMDGLGNVLMSTGPVAMGAAAQTLLVAAPGAYNLPPGEYNLAFQLSNVTALIQGVVAVSGSNLAGCTRNTEAAMGIVSVSMNNNQQNSFPQIDILVAGKRQTYK